MKQLRNNIHFLVLTISVIVCSCGQEVYTGISENDYYENANVLLESRPNGARIFLNNKNMGLLTPDTLRWLSTGNYTVTLKKEFFQDTTFIISVIGKQLISVFIDFTLNSKNYGKINCNSNPIGAKIFLDDSITSNSTPYILNFILPGYHKVKLSYENHRADSTSVLVKSSETSQMYLTLEDTSSWVSYNTLNSSIISNEITSIKCDDKNIIWVGTNKGLNSFDGRIWKKYNSENSPLIAEQVTCIEIDNENRKWIGTSNGLFVFNEIGWINYSSILPNTTVNKIIFDKLGNTWVGTADGLVKYEKGIWYVYKTDNSGLRENYITELMVDKTNRVWIGTVFNGINVFDGINWQYFDSSSMKTSNYSFSGSVKAIYEDSNGRIWVSLLGQDYIGTLAYYDGDEWYHFKDHSLLFNGVLTINELDNKLILGTKNGLGILYGNNSFIFHNKGNYRLDYLRTIDISADRNGNLWLATFNQGVAKFKSGSF